MRRLTVLVSAVLLILLVAGCSDTDGDGDVSVVAACDIYDFDDGQVTEIVSYTVEVSS